MSKPTDKDIDIIARAIAEIIRKLDRIEDKTLHNEDILMFLQDLFDPPRNLVSSDEELVQFTKELYRQICEYCGEDGMKFMGIA
jgi:hypothetical protein